MKNKNQVPATIMLAVGAVFSAAGVFLLINRFTPMWSFSHKYMTDNAIFVMLAILGLFIGVISLLFARSLFKQGREIQEGDSMKQHMGIKATQRITNTVVYVLLVLISIIWLAPFFCIVVQSFRINPTGMTRYLFENPEAALKEGLTIKFGLDNYTRLFNETKFPTWYLNTFIIAVVVAAVQTIIVLCMSYTLSRFRFKLRKPLMQFMLILGMFPGMLTMIILYQVLKDIGLAGANAMPGLILVYVASSGMGYYVSKGFFDTIPKSLDEAARIDGATRAQVLYKIILPMAKPIVIYTILTAFMGPWGDFVFAKYVTGITPEAWNVAVGLQQWLSTSTNISENYTMFCTGGVVVAIPVVILFMCLQKYDVEGVTGGAVKG